MLPEPAAISPDPLAEQNRQPPVPLEPSLFGHVKPPSRESFTTLPPNSFFRYVLIILMRRSCPSDVSKIKNEGVLISNTLKPEEFDALHSSTLDCISFICLLEDDVPKKIYSYKQRNQEWVLNDEFSGYLKTNEDSFPKSLVSKEIITVEEFINNN